MIIAAIRGLFLVLLIFGMHLVLGQLLQWLPWFISPTCTYRGRHIGHLSQYPEAPCLYAQADLHRCEEADWPTPSCRIVQRMLMDPKDRPLYSAFSQWFCHFVPINYCFLLEAKGEITSEWRLSLPKLFPLCPQDECFPMKYEDE